MAQGAGPSLIELDIKELERACDKLESSNAELASYLAEHGPDVELEAAIKDNVVAISVKQERIKDLKELRSKGIMPTFLSSDPGKEKTAVTIQWSEKTTDGEELGEVAIENSASQNKEQSAGEKNVDNGDLASEGVFL